MNSRVKSFNFAQAEIDLETSTAPLMATGFYARDVEFVPKSTKLSKYVSALKEVTLVLRLLLNRLQQLNAPWFSNTPHSRKCQ